MQGLPAATGVIGYSWLIWLVFIVLLVWTVRCVLASQRQNRRHMPDFRIDGLDPFDGSNHSADVQWNRTHGVQKPGDEAAAQR